jgi:14-3-3 protein epsilon
MAKSVSSIAKLHVALTVEERNLFSVAFKNVIGNKRASWRIVSSIQQKEKNAGKFHCVQKSMQYQAKIELEIVSICNEVINLIENYLLPYHTDLESEVFYYKMKGDYLRYLVEIQPSDHSASKSRQAYQHALSVAEGGLPATNPIRLGVALNFSVFYYEVANRPDLACKMAKDAFDAAIVELDTLTEESYKDSTVIMQLMRDGNTLWTSDVLEDEDIDSEWK